jgi:hypothetical protein
MDLGVALQDVENRLQQICPGHEIAIRGYLDRCVATLDTMAEVSTSVLVALEHRVEQSLGQARLALVHRLLALRLHRERRRALESLDLPEEVQAFYREDFARIAGDTMTRPDDHFTFSNYRFKCDLRLLCLRRIPIGMYDLDVSGVPRRLLLRQPPRDAIRLLGDVLRCGGFYPFFTQHVVPHRLSYFNPVGRRRSLALSAHVLVARAEIRGLLSTAWYNDPAIERVSPHLAYLRASLEALGGHPYRIGSPPEVVSDALANSLARQRFHRAGAYQPTAYLMIVPRRALIERLSADDGGTP